MKKKKKKICKFPGKKAFFRFVDGARIGQHELPRDDDFTSGLHAGAAAQFRAEAD